MKCWIHIASLDICWGRWTEQQWLMRNCTETGPGSGIVDSWADAQSIVGTLEIAKTSIYDQFNIHGNTLLIDKSDAQWSIQLVSIKQNIISSLIQCIFYDLSSWYGDRSGTLLAQATEKKIQEYSGLIVMNLIVTRGHSLTSPCSSRQYLKNTSQYTTSRQCYLGKSWFLGKS